MIGVFDSGSGGMSVYRELVKLLPEARFVYYADNAHCPYGEKTAAYIRRRARAITRTLLEKGCGIIVVACNTATAAAIRHLRETFPDVPFIGMEPAVKPAALGTKTGVIGVLATAGTLKGSKYLTTKGKYEDDVRIEEHVGVPAWDRTVIATRKDLLLGDYLVDAHLDECLGVSFMGTTIPFGAPDFRDWEETMTFFARICGESR